jgi:hypothetical protein
MNHWTQCRLGRSPRPKRGSSGNFVQALLRVEREPVPAQVARRVRVLLRQMGWRRAGRRARTPGNRG